jgi:hypothetical protein
MKILHKPKMLPVECKRCGCCFKAKIRNLVMHPLSKNKDGVKCPVCHTINLASFDKQIKEDAE